MSRLLKTFVVRSAATDAQLLGRFIRDRDDAAFTELVRRHGPLVLGVCRRTISDRHLADDAFQATFVVLARKADSIQSATHLASWLYGVSHKVALRARTMAGRRAKHETLTANPPDTAVRPDPIDELDGVLDAEIANLPALYRDAVVLCELQGVSRYDATKTLGILEGTLSSRLAKARKLLAIALARRGVTLPATLAVSTTVTLELCTATVRASTGAIAPAAVTTLADGVIHMMLLAKLKAISIATFAGMLLLGGLSFSLLSHTLAQGPTAKLQPVQVEKPKIIDGPKPGFDALGDPLPDGAISRLGTSRLRGSRLTFSPDSRRIVRETANGDLQLYEVPTGKFLAKLRAADVPERHNIIGTTIGFSPDSKLLAAVLWEGRTGIWNTDTGKLVRWIESGKFYSIVGCDFSPDGKFVAIGDSEPKVNNVKKLSINMYEVATGKKLLTEQGSIGKFTDDGKQLVTWDGFNAGGPKMSSISVADPDNRITLDHKTHVPNSEDPRTDGQSAIIELLEAGTVQIRDMKTGEVKQTLEGAKRSVKGGVNLRRASGRRELIVTQAEPPHLWCWNIDTGKELWQRDLPSPPHWADLSTDGKTFVTPGKEGEVLTIDALTGKDRAVIETKSVGHSNFRSNVSPDGNVVATFTAAPEPGGGTVLFWDAATGKLLTKLPGHTALIHDAIFTPDGSKIITAGRDNTLRTWDAINGQELANVALTAPGQLAQSPEGQKLYASEPKSGTIRVVDPATGKVLTTFPAFKKLIVGFTLTVDGKRLIVAGRDADEAGMIRVVTAATGELVREFPTGDYCIEQMAASADGTVIVTACTGRKLVVWSGDGKLLSEHAGAGKRKPSWEDRPLHYLIGSVAISADGLQIAFSDQEVGVAVIDGPTQKLLGHAKQKDIYFQDYAARYDVRDVMAVSPDGKTVAWSGLESTPDIFVIELRSQSVRRRLPGDSYPVKRLAFSPDGSKLLSTGPDGSALVWDLFGRYSRKPTAQPDPKTVALWWEELGSLNAGTADKTMRAMASRPAEAIQLLKEKLSSPVVGAAAIDALITELGDRDFATREAASKALLQIPAAETKLAAVFDASDSVEVRNRAELVLNHLRRSTGLSGDRAMEVLTWIGTVEAKKLLADLAKGPDERLSRDATKTLQRLK